MDNRPSDTNFILLNIGYTKLDKTWNWSDIYSPFARLYYISEGAALVRLNGKELKKIEAGNLYLIPPFTRHDDISEGDFAMYYVHFYEDIRGTDSLFKRYSFPFRVKASEMDIMLVQRLLEVNPSRELSQYDPKSYDNPLGLSEFIANNRKQPLYSVIESCGILTQLFSRFFREAVDDGYKKDRRILASLSYIHSNLSKRIDVTSLARMACLSEDHFIRLFKEETGTTPVKYISGRKMEKAQLMLLTTDKPVSEISFELGYEEASYFVKVFKKMTGRTPTAYRLENAMYGIFRNVPERSPEERDD